MSVKASLFIASLFTLTLAGCGEFPVQDGGPGFSADLSGTPDPVPRWEPRSAYGNPPSYQVDGVTYQVMQDAAGYVERGVASWYGEKFHGRYTSSREIYDMHGMSAAHRSLPLPTYVRVTNLQNGRSCVVRVNDRGPFHSDRIIDLSYAAASKLGIVEAGTAMVEVRAIQAGEATDAPQISEAVVTAHPGFRAEVMPLPQPISLPVAAPTPAAPVVAPAPKANGTRLYVQVAAFSSRDNAERLRERLGSEEKITAYIHETGTPARGVLYLVRVGPFTDSEEAERVKTRIAGLGLGKPGLIREQVLPTLEAQR